MRNFHKIIMCLGLLVSFTFGCSKGETQHQFALDAVAKNQGFDKNKNHWVLKFGEENSTKMSEKDIVHGAFLTNVLQKTDFRLLPKVGELVVCWQDKDKKVYLSIFDPKYQNERLTVPLKAVSECSKWPL